MLNILVVGNSQEEIKAIREFLEQDDDHNDADTIFTSHVLGTELNENLIDIDQVASYSTQAFNKNIAEHARLLTIRYTSRVPSDFVFIRI